MDDTSASGNVASQGAGIPGSEAVPAAAPAALREDQIQNAIAFLSHPKVRESPEATKTAFLRNKGLTEAEIAEAMRRVPPSPAAAATAAAPTPAAAPAAVPATSTALVPHAPLQVAVAPPQHQLQGVRWTQAVLGLSVVAAAAYGVVRYVAPAAAQWYHSWSSHSQQQQEEAAKQQAQLQATLASVQSSQQQLAEAISSLNDTLKQMAAARADEASSWQMLGDFGAAGIAGSTYNPSTMGQLASDTWGPGASNPYNAGTSRRAAAATGPVPSSSSFLGGGAGGTPGGPGAVAVTPTSQGRPGSAASSGRPAGAAGGGGGGGGGGGAAAAGEAGRDDAPYSQAFTDVIEMVRSGKVPSNVRTDINDKPPDPSRSFSTPQARPVNKPWQRGVTGGSTAADVWARPGTPPNGISPSTGSNSSSPAGRSSKALAATPGYSSNAAMGSSSSHQQQQQQPGGLNPSAAPWRPAGRPAPFSMYEMEAEAAAAAQASVANGLAGSPDQATSISSTTVVAEGAAAAGGSGGGGPTAEEAVALFQQSMTAATAASRGSTSTSSTLDKSYLALLGHDPGRSDGPWRPPPPPPASVRTSSAAPGGRGGSAAAGTAARPSSATAAPAAAAAPAADAGMPAMPTAADSTGSVAEEQGRMTAGQPLEAVSAAADGSPAAAYGVAAGSEAAAAALSTEVVAAE